MSKKLFYLIGVFLTIIIGTLLYCKLCDSCNCYLYSNVKTEDSSVVLPEVIATYNPFSIKDANGDFEFNIKDNLNFKKSNFTIIEPISTKVNNKIIKIKDYLAINPLKSLEITGYYTSVEKNNSAYPNLGLARANVAKNYLISTGISSKQIDTNGDLNDNLLSDNEGIYYGPLLYEISTREEGDTRREDRIIALGNGIKENPLILYFDTGGFTINLTSEQRQKVVNISRYIDKVEDAKIYVIGHTDNTGGKFTNIKLGQERADFVKRYLVGNSIPDSKIEAISEGSENPVADNTTEEGRAKNRYVLITIN